MREERRTYLRLKEPFRVELHPWSEGPNPPQGPDLEKWIAFSRDVSVGGLCVVGARPAVAGSIVEMRVFAAELQKPLSLVGQVVRSDRRPDGRYDIAIRLAPRWIDEGSRQSLERLVYGI